MTVMQSTLINMLIYIALVALGILLGGRHLWGEGFSRLLGKVQLASLLALITALGIRLGADEEVMGSLGRIGLASLTITLFSMAGSLIAVTLLRRYILHLDRFGRQKETAEEPASGSGTEETPNSGLTKWIVIAVAAGMGIGYFVFSGRSTAWCGTIIDVGLYILLFLVGIDMGQQGHVLENIRSAGFKVLLVPGAVVIGTLLFSFVGSFLLPLRIKETVVSAGIRWPRPCWPRILSRCRQSRFFPMCSGKSFRSSRFLLSRDQSATWNASLFPGRRPWTPCCR